MEQKQFKTIDRIRYIFVGSSDTRAEIASKANIPENFIRTIARDADPNVREVIAERNDLPDDLIRTFASDKNFGIRAIIAQRPNLPEDLIRTLFSDKSRFVRKTIEGRPDLPEDVRRVLNTNKHNDDDWAIRRDIAKNSVFSEKELQAFEADKSHYQERNDRDIRVAIAKNPDLPVDVIHTLTADEDIAACLNNNEAVYPGTQNRLWNYPPYTVTDLRFDKHNPEHINSITIMCGKGNSKRFSGNQIDKNNNLVFKQDDMAIKYGLLTGEAEFFPHLKEDKKQETSEYIGPKL